jgi:hypothetical protein
MNEKPKIEGWRKLGLGASAIAALSIKGTIDFKIAIIIGVIAIVGIVVQGVLDYGKKKIPKVD